MAVLVARDPERLLCPLLGKAGVKQPEEKPLKKRREDCGTNIRHVIHPVSPRSGQTES